MSTDVATTESTTNEATLKTKRGGKKAKGAKAAMKAAKKRDRGTAKRKSKSQREAGGTKKEIVLELLRRKDGATIADIAKATRWQNHSIRGFISGSVSKKMDLPSNRPRTMLASGHIGSLDRVAAPPVLNNGWRNLPRGRLRVVHVFCIG